MVHFRITVTVLEMVFFEMGEGGLLKKQLPTLTHALSSSAPVDPDTYAFCKVRSR